MSSTFDRNFSRRLARPNDPSGRQFEEMCLIIYGREYGTRDAVFYNRGHGQDGIDLKLLVPATGGNGRSVVVQCKDTARLAPSAIAPDIRRAIARWKPGAAGDADLELVVATTAERPNHDKIRATFEAIRAELVDAALHHKVRFVVHGWDDVTRIVHGDVELMEYFVEPDVRADDVRSVELGRLATGIEDGIAAHELATARGYWEGIRAIAPPARLSVPIGETLVRLFLAAGDFAALDELLDSLLDRRRYRASYWVAYLRAKRYTSMVTRHATSLGEMSVPPGIPFRLGDAMGQHEAFLLAAQGSFDEKLTLALWMVVHAARQEVAARGLVRALSLLRQYWPAACPMPAAGEQWTVRQGRLVRRADLVFGRLAPAAARSAPTPDERTTLALAWAYGYVRMVYAARFSYPELQAAEHEGGGWAEVVDDTQGWGCQDVDRYFGSLARGRGRHAVAAAFREAGLAGFHAEGMRMECAWDELGQVYRRLEEPCRHLSAVCTAEVLLTDCETGQLERRRAELYLSVATLELERLLAVLCMLEIVAGQAPAPAGHPSVEAWRRDRLRAIVAACTRAPRRPSQQFIQAHAAYDDQSAELAATPGLAPGLRASIALAGRLRAPLIVVHGQLARALAAGTATVLLYGVRDEAGCGPAHPGSSWQTMQYGPARQ